MKHIMPIAVVTLSLAASADAGPRTVMDLTGTWQIAEGSMDAPPKQYDHTVPVPGLADMADPAFAEPGGTVPLEQRLKPWEPPVDARREAFWYRRTVRIEGPVPPVALLKVHKAKYGTKVFVNGAAAGEYMPCYTPGWFDVRTHLSGGGKDNELLVRVGASMSALPKNILTGWDNEKKRYIPGIYDRVELVLTGTPHVVNVQTAADIENGMVRVVAEVANASTAPTDARIRCAVAETASGNAAGQSVSGPATVEPGATRLFDVRVPIANCRLWSPEDPFLYTLTVDTGTDEYTTRFGMRTFETDPEKGTVLLNGRPYYLRGSNVCIYRFFGDPKRGGLPWDEQWVRRLHRRFKDMHWNSLRYCIGFPPEQWYEIADEEGILIQDEFPIWYSRAKNGWPASITTADVVAEYTAWMRERWNHPCVVIWDAQNETRNDSVTRPAIGKVRGLDLSGRVWENGWGTPQSARDVCEYHPYRLTPWRMKRHPMNLSLFQHESGIPNNGPRKGGHPPRIINEYGWLWINRDGSLPTLTRDVYAAILGPDATEKQRRLYYGRTLAAMTEFWRCRRKCAGVMHFCGLAYSRPDGQTCDNFIDIEKLEYDPYFYEYVRDAFSPVGLCIDYWAQEVPPGKSPSIPVLLVNDQCEKWEGTLTLRLGRGERTIREKEVACAVGPLGAARRVIPVPFPDAPGPCLLTAEINAGGETVRSLRDIAVAKPSLSLGKPVTASTELTKDGETYPARFAVDGKSNTRWSSAFADPQWLTVDLGERETINRVVIRWETAAAKAYTIDVSGDGKEWQTVHAEKNGDGGVDDIRFDPVAARHVRISGTRRTTEYGYSIRELQVFGK